MRLEQPAYIASYHSGSLRRKVESSRQKMKDCDLCPRRCNIDRYSQRTGVCQTGKNARVSSYAPHFGEEDPLVGQNGSGTIFFTHCNLKCIFCQNYELSHDGIGSELSDRQLANIMLELQAMGCHNINLVSPSHVVPQILSALEYAVPDGLSIPLVYNTGGYDRVETLALLDNIIDIYMPDFKFWDSDWAAKACDADDYPHVARRAIMEMHRQVGDLQCDSNGLAQSGLLIRHLVLPGGISGTRKIMRFVAEKISLNSYVNLMSQYRPCGRASEMDVLATPISASDFRAAVEMATQEGIRRLDRPGRLLL